MDYLVAPISKYAERAHYKVLERVRQFTGDFSFGRRVFETKLRDCHGTLTEPLNDGRAHIIVDRKVARFRKTFNYRTFVAENPGRAVTPESVFMAIVAHEYGHLFFDERLSPRIWNLAKREKLFRLPPEFEESFAFCFGERASGIRAPVEDCADSYRKDGLDPDKLLDFYFALRVVSRDDRKAILSPENLVQMIEDLRN